MTLSHVKAYLQIGNVTKADERFKTIQTPELVPGAMFTLAQLRAAKGDSLGSQQAFIFALDNQSSPEQPVSYKLLEYFCQKKMWLALESYGANLLDSSIDIEANNQAMGIIGKCYFKNQESVKAKYWLNKLDLMLPVDPLDFLVLARLSIEDNQYTEAEKFIIRFEETKKKVDAYTLWTALEVYQKLQKPKLADQIGQHLILLFPNTDYSLVYREMLKPNNQSLNRMVKEEVPKQAKIDTEGKTHTIQKGETLYQLSKLYGVTIPELQAWNPSLVIDDISVGTKIRVTRGQ